MKTEAWVEKMALAEKIEEACSGVAAVEVCSLVFEVVFLRWEASIEPVWVDLSCPSACFGHRRN